MVERTCLIEGCNHPYYGRGWCSMHWQRWRKHGDPSYVPTFQKDQPCSIKDCGKLIEKRGWCGMHYRRWRINGDPLTVKVIRAAGSPEERFWTKVHLIHPFGCWWWTAHRNVVSGYGYFAVGNGHGMQLAHRFAYETLIGQVPDGLELDHLCRNRACVNPDHLEPVTRSENVRRGVGWLHFTRRNDGY